MTAENVISANVRMGRPPFYCAEWARDRITEKYGITPENEAEVAARILAEEDARWASSVEKANERKRKAEEPPAVEAPKVSRDGISMFAKIGLDKAFKAFMKPLEETLKTYEAKAESFKSSEFEHMLYSGDVEDLKRQIKKNDALRTAAFKAINDVFENFDTLNEIFGRE